MEFSSLIGLVIKKIMVCEAYPFISFHTDNDTFILHFNEICCDRGYIADICGDLKDLIGVPILDASFESNSSKVDISVDKDVCWAYYKLSTINGYVSIRWIADGYYFYGTEVIFSKENNQSSTRIIVDGRYTLWKDLKLKIKVVVCYE